jgi:putative endonuclease
MKQKVCQEPFLNYFTTVMQKGFVYILQSEKSKKYYVGSTINLEMRLAQHNGGRVVSTKNKGPWLVVFHQEYQDVAHARQVEYKIKQKKSKKFIEKIILDENIPAFL